MTKQLKEIEIPFGAKDSELCGWEYTIPEGMEAIIVDNKIVVKKKESEDERIRKALKEYLINSFQNNGVAAILGVHIKDILIWLEKQGEHKKFRDGIQVGDKVTRNRDGMLVNLSQLNRVAKKDEQKPVDKVKPKFKVKYAGSEYNVLEVKDIAGVTYYGIEDEPNHIDYVQAENCERVDGYSIKESGSPFPTKPAKFSEQKPADTPKFKVGDVMRTIQEAADNITDGLPVVVSIDEEYYHCTNELIAIKDQEDYEYPPMNRKKKPAWSEEDKKTIDEAVECLENYAEYVQGGFSKQHVLDLASRVESLKDRYSWKPSDEQMDALNLAIGEANSVDTAAGDEAAEILTSLYEQLKKLREE